MLTADAERAIAMIDTQAPLVPLHHRRACCEAAARWIRSLGAPGGDSWAELGWTIGARLPWGTIAWPAAWCELARGGQFDSTAAAAAVELALASHGLDPVRVQALVDTQRTGHLIDGPGWGIELAPGLTYLEGISVAGSERVILPQDGRELILGGPWRHGYCVAVRRWSAEGFPTWEMK